MKIVPSLEKDLPHTAEAVLSVELQWQELVTKLNMSKNSHRMLLATSVVLADVGKRSKSSRTLGVDDEEKLSSVCAGND